MPWLVGQQGEVPLAFCRRPGSGAHGYSGPYLLAYLSHIGQGSGYGWGMTCPWGVWAVNAKLQGETLQREPGTKYPADRDVLAPRALATLVWKVLGKPGLEVTSARCFHFAFLVLLCGDPGRHCPDPRRAVSGVGRPGLSPYPVPPCPSLTTS